MRCNQSVLSAFLANPRMNENPALIHWAQTMLGYEYAQYAPPAVARAIIQDHREAIIGRQARTGFWKPNSRGNSSHTPAVSCRILQGIEQADMLAEIGTATLPFKYDPFPPFAERDDLHGLLVRRMFRRPLPNDEVTTAQLLQSFLTQQREDGSWAGTVVSTALTMQRLLDLGMATDAPAITRGAQWLLSQYRESFPRRKIVARHLFCSESCGQEFADAQQEIPETIPVRACYGHLPLIPTGLALRMLVITGYGNDPRVAASFASLLKLADPVYAEDGGTLLSMSGWCAHACVFQLEREAKLERIVARIS